MKLMLFDVDGTLITTGGAGTAAMDRAFERLYGVAGAFAHIRMGGMMDPKILDMAREKAGIDTLDLEAYWPVYVPMLREELVERADRGRVHPGVETLLQRLADDPDVRVGLLTGNHEDGARAKLEHFGLFHHFELGAYGNDGDEREELVPVALSRVPDGAQPDAVIVVGDTDRDIRCAQANGAASIAVATGPLDPKALAAHEPTFVFETLADTDRVLEAIASV